MTIMKKIMKKMILIIMKIIEIRIIMIINQEIIQEQNMVKIAKILLIKMN